MGILIPPSVGFIFYAIVTEESIGKLFVAGILPGVLLAVLFSGISDFDIFSSREGIPFFTIEMLNDT